MSGFDVLLDQEKPCNLLRTAILKGRLPYAFLFTGIEGVGKKTAALAFAMAGNCRKQKKEPEAPDADAIAPCGECSACRKIISGNHPDIHVIKPSGTIIKVDQVRSLCRKLALKPFEAKLRVALIADAHLLNKEAGNTLLKILEEPPEQTVFILTALQADDVLPTILSRCRHIRFSPISRKTLQAHLENTLGLKPSKAGALASMAGGSMTRAMAMAESDWLKKRDWIIEQTESFSTDRINRGLVFSETLAGEKKQLLPALAAMKGWFRDLLVCRYAPESIINLDLFEKIRIASKQATVKGLLLKIKAIEKAEHDIRANANPRLTLDTLVVTLLRDR